MKWVVFFAAVVFSTKLSSLECRAGEQTASVVESAQRVEQIRAECIQNRRRICGKILKITPEGMVIDSGYTNLMRMPLNRSWLVPGTATVSRATNLIEANQPGAVCFGPVYLTELPKKTGVKPRLYDYVNLEAFPAGQYTWTSVGDVQRTLRRFSTKIDKAIEWRLDETEKEKQKEQKN